MNGVVNPWDKPLVDGKTMFEVDGLATSNNGNAPQGDYKIPNPVKIAHSSSKYAST